VALRPDKSCEGSAQARSESDFPPTSEDIPPAIWDSHSHIDDCIVLLNYQKANDKRQTCAGLPKEESGKRKAESGKQKVGGGLSGGAGGIAWSTIEIRLPAPRYKICHVSRTRARANESKPNYIKFSSSAGWQIIIKVTADRQPIEDRTCIE